MHKSKGTRLQCAGPFLAGLRESLLSPRERGSWGYGVREGWVSACLQRNSSTSAPLPRIPAPLTGGTGEIEPANPLVPRQPCTPVLAPVRAGARLPHLSAENFNRRRERRRRRSAGAHGGNADTPVPLRGTPESRPRYWRSQAPRPLATSISSRRREFAPPYNASTPSNHAASTRANAGSRCRWRTIPRSISPTDTTLKYKSVVL